MQQKKQTAAHQRTQEIQSAMQQILAAVGITNDEYCEMQYHCGLSFLAYKCKVSEERIQASKIFWAWWKTNWAMRDEVFLEETQNMLVTENGTFVFNNYVNKSHYLLTHNPYHLSSKLDPYGEMLHKAWVQILDIINNEFVKHKIC